MSAPETQRKRDRGLDAVLAVMLALAFAGAALFLAPMWNDNIDPATAHTMRTWGIALKAAALLTMAAVAFRVNGVRR